jgi:hypothetical protein
MNQLGPTLALAALLLGTPLSAQAPPAAADAAAPAAPAADAAPPAAAAADAPKPLRELFTTAAGVTDPATALLTVGSQTSYARDRSQAQRFPAQIFVGICPWLDLRASWSGPTTLKDPQGSSQSGGGDPMFGGQLQGLHQDPAGLDLGLAYWHKLPRASVEKGIGTGKADDTLLVTASRTDGPWEVDMNGGANWLGQSDGDGRTRQGVIALAVTRACGSGWNVSLDHYALAATELGPRSVTSILAVSRDVTPNLCLDLGVEAGLTHSAERLALDAGLVWRVGHLWGQPKGE